MKKYKIAYFHNSIDLMGGLERVIINKSNALAEMGHEVAIVVTDHKDDAIFVQPLSDKVKLVDLKVGHWFSKKKWHSPITNRIKHYNRINTFIKNWNPDVVISCGQEEKHILAFIACNGIKIREIHLISDYRNRIYSKKWLANILNIIDYKILAYFYDQYVILTEEDFENFYLGKKKKTSVIPNPLTIIPKQSDVTRKEIVTACRLTKSKLINEMIEAFRLVYEKHADWKLLIYGEGPEYNQLYKKITDYNLNESIILKGRTNNIPSVFSNASIFCCTSSHEGFNLTLLEAIACGLPVVTYQFPVGAKDILEDSDAGYLVPMHNIEMLAEKICYLIEHEEVRSEMSKNAIKRANDFEIGTIMSKWIKLFEELIAKKCI